MTQAETTSMAAAVSGRATGVLFFAGFGSLWLYNGLDAMHSLTPLGVVAIGVICAALVIPAVMLLRSASRTAKGSRASQESFAEKRSFVRVNVTQWAAILAANLLFSVFHKQEFLTPVITFIVGAHLISLARLFRFSMNYVTGTLLMSWATVMAMVFPGAMMPTIGAVGTAAFLLGGAVCTLTSAGRAAKLSLTLNSLHIAGM